MRATTFLLVLFGALAASACDHGPAGAESLPNEVAASVEAVPAMTLGDLSPAPSAHGGSTALDALPWDERISLEQALAATDARYAPRMDERGPVLETPGSVVATFTASGAHLSFGGREATLRVAALGREGALRALGESSPPTVVGAEVRTARRPGLIEWWRSLPSGLEHGVTIAERPAGDGELWVEVAVGGDLSAQLLSDDTVELRDSSGARVALYAHLEVLDASGTHVPAHMSMDGERIALVIEDASARYPLLIDPLVTAQEATLLAPDGAPSNDFGCSVAFSADGTRALVGACRDGAGGINAGSAGVFLRTGSTWAHEAKLFAPDRTTGDEFGYSVALSADGSRALIGARRDGTVAGSSAGSARVFLRTGTSWAQEAVLLAPDGEANDYFGHSVAFSGDGLRALVGAYFDDTVGGANAGSARVFVRSGSSWSYEATLLAPDGAFGDQLGHSVALSTDGSRALVGAIYDDIGGVDAGSARSFVRTGTSWTHEATLYASDGAAYEYFGRSVALSSDGGRALVGAYFDDAAGRTECGTARVFLRTGTTWTEEATLLAPDAGAFDHAGVSVALSADGARALVGASGDDTVGGQDGGSANVFVRVGTTWTHEASLLAPDGAIWDALGSSVALSSDGSRGLVGVPGDASDRGSARVFSLPIRADGEPCAGSDAECLSGFCTDGVCCAARCGGGAADCQACSAALTGGASGTCAALSPTVAPTVVCRASGGAPCDSADTCTSTSTTCPDVFVTAGTMCRAAAGACDVADLCDGLGTACPDARAVGGTTCRLATGSCDRREACDGVSVTCPPDEIESSGVTCRPIAGPCDAAERCSGVSSECPSDAVVAAGAACGPAPTTTCDAPDVCNGSSTSCPIAFEPATTPCGPPVAGFCDAPDHCSGTSADCVASFLSGVECRPQSGTCDSAEFCTGTVAACPPDAVEASGMSCRASTDTSCDPEEMCDGVAVGCPADVTSCTPRPDAGLVDAGPRSDTGPALDAAATDAGPPLVAAEGCACRLAPSRARLPVLLCAAFAVAAVSVRRRRR